MLCRLIFFVSIFILVAPSFSAHHPEFFKDETIALESALYFPYDKIAKEAQEQADISGVSSEVKPSKKFALPHHDENSIHVKKYRLANFLLDSLNFGDGVNPVFFSSDYSVAVGFKKRKRRENTYDLHCVIAYLKDKKIVSNVYDLAVVRINTSDKIETSFDSGIPKIIIKDSKQKSVQAVMGPFFEQDLRIHFYVTPQYLSRTPAQGNRFTFSLDGTEEKEMMLLSNDQEKFYAHNQAQSAKNQESHSKLEIGRPAQENNTSKQSELQLNLEPIIQVTDGDGKKLIYFNSDNSVAIGFTKKDFKNHEWYHNYYLHCTVAFFENDSVVVKSFDAPVNKITGSTNFNVVSERFDGRPGIHNGIFAYGGGHMTYGPFIENNNQISFYSVLSFDHPQSNGKKYTFYLNGKETIEKIENIRRYIPKNPEH